MYSIVTNAAFLASMQPSIALKLRPRGMTEDTKCRWNLAINSNLDVYKNPKQFWQHKTWHHKKEPSLSITLCGNNAKQSIQQDNMHSALAAYVPCSLTKAACTTRLTPESRDCARFNVLCRVTDLQQPYSAENVLISIYFSYSHNTAKTMTL